MVIGDIGHSVTLQDVYEATTGRALISGIQAIVRLALDQRRLDSARGYDTGAFLSGYEGSPLGGLDLELVRAGSSLQRHGVVFSPGLNEELAATAVGGTQLLGELPGRRHDGVVGFWFGKNPGLDRAADAIRHANMSGTSPLGGAVALVGDDPDGKSSTLPSGCEPMVRSLAVPLLAPTGVGDLMRLGLHAVALSRFAGVWTALKVVPAIADAAAVVDLQLPADAIPPPDLTRQAHPPVLIGPRSVEAEEQLVTVRLPRVAEYARSVGLNTVQFEPRQPVLGVVASGTAYAAVQRALADLGIDEDGRQLLGLRLIRIAMPWPIDIETARRLCHGVREVLVVEDKAPFIEAQLKEALYRQPEQPLIVGKRDENGAPLVPAHGAVTADVAARVLLARLGGRALPGAVRRRAEELEGGVRRRLTVRNADTLPARTPYFCSGCPHNVSTRASDDQLVGVGIGCHIMAALDGGGRGHLLGMTQMGGEGAQWNGMAPFTDDTHYFQNLGDGTYFHSGSLAVRAAVASGVNITYKLLYNDAVAMTGGQTPQGRLDVPALTRLLALEGVRTIVVTTPDPARYHGVRLDPAAAVRHRDELPAVQEELGRTPGVSVLIHDDRCAAEERRLRKRGKLPARHERVWINSRVCEGCGDCAATSTCLSVVPVETEFGTKTAIHQGSCNQDYTCVKGDCPSFVVVTPGHRRRPDAGALPVDLTPAERLRVPGGTCLIRMPGVGGTGVVTVSRILQMAAHLEGRWASGLDQTGLAQKGGPVISDVRLSERPVEGALQAGRGTADVLLGLDLLGAAADDNLTVADPRRTVAVVNTAQVATAAMVTGAGTPEGPHHPPLSRARARIDRATRQPENLYLDAQWISERLFDHHLQANMVLVGAAFQHGCLPLSAEALEEAVRLNAVAVEENLHAFRWGRACALDPDAVHRALAPAPAGSAGAPTSPAATRMLGEVDVPEALRHSLTTRVADLVDYQDARYARRYLHDVLEVAALEELPATGASGFPVAEAYARNLYKLMAYKDEYEVARLHLLTSAQEALADEFGADARVKVMLHPPILAALGLRRKVHLGPVTRPTFRSLRAARRLRGTALDPFGRTDMRRTERALADEYRRQVAQALTYLSPSTVDQVVAVAELPDMIRGYEQVKRANIERFRARGTELLATLGSPDHGAGPGSPRPEPPADRTDRADARAPTPVAAGRQRPVRTVSP